MRLEIEVSEGTLETFKELVEGTEISVSEYVGRAVDGLAMLASGEMPGYALVEFLVDPPEFEEDEDEEGGEGVAPTRLLDRARTVQLGRGA